MTDSGDSVAVEECPHDSVVVMGYSGNNAEDATASTKGSFDAPSGISDTFCY